MSAFIVSDLTINELVSAFDHDADTRRMVWGFGAVVTDTMRADLAQRMADLNVAGVVARYGEDDNMGERAPFVYRYEMPPSKVQAFKSLQCFLYQCNEGNIAETSELYRKLEEVGRRMAFDIVSELPEYARAGWGR